MGEKARRMSFASRTHGAIIASMLVSFYVLRVRIWLKMMSDCSFKLHADEYTVLRRVAGAALGIDVVRKSIFSMSREQELQ